MNLYAAKDKIILLFIIYSLRSLYARLTTLKPVAMVSTACGF